METTKKRTREEVRAAFRAFMREKEEERKAAQIRLELYHQKERLEEKLKALLQYIDFCVLGCQVDILVDTLAYVGLAEVSVSYGEAPK